MEALIYARVSTKEQEESGYSLPAQEKILGEYAEKKNFRVKKMFAVSESASGKVLRKKFAEMLEFAKKKKINILIFEKVDRVTRNFKEYQLIDDWLNEDPERQIHSVKNGIILHKNSKSQDVLNWDLNVVLAKNYIKNLSEEVKKGQKEKISQGEYPSQPPLGYRSEGPRGRRVHLPDEKFAPYITKMFKLYASGLYSTESLAIEMEKDGLRSKYGNVIKKRLTWEILHNLYYTGKFRWNGVVYQGKHEPLISEELYNLVQEKLTGRAVPHITKRNFLFKGMMRCGKCGSVISWEEHKGHIYGHCNYKYTKCDERIWMKEEVVLDEIAESFGELIVKNPRIADWIVKSLKLSHTEDTEYKEHKLTELQANHQRMEKRLDRLYEDRLDELISDANYRERFAQYTKQKDDILSEIDGLSKSSEQKQQIGVKIFQRAEVAQEKFKLKVPEVQKKILKDICESIKIENGKPIIEYTIAMQTLQRAVKQTNESSENKKMTEIGKDISEPVNFSHIEAEYDPMSELRDIWRPGPGSNRRPPP